MDQGPPASFADRLVAWFKLPQKDGPAAEALRWVWRVCLAVLVLYLVTIAPQLWTYLQSWVAFIPGILLLAALLLLPVTIRSIEKRDGGQ